MLGSNSTVLVLVGHRKIDDDGLAGHRIKDDDRHRILLLMIGTVGQARPLLVAFPGHCVREYAIARELVMTSFYGLRVNARC